VAYPSFKMSTQTQSCSDVELFEALVKRETWALETLYDRHAARLNGLAIKILKDEYWAEEVLQEIFLKIWSHPEMFCKSKGTPLGWMMVLCRNRAIDKLRMQHSKTCRTITLDEESLPQDTLWGSSTHPEDEIDYDDLRDQIRAGLKKLPDEQAILIEKAFYEGSTQSELSQELELPLGTVKTRMRLAMQKLRNHLSET